MVALLSIRSAIADSISGVSLGTLTERKSSGVLTVEEDGTWEMVCHTRPLSLMYRAARGYCVVWRWRPARSWCPIGYRSQFDLTYALPPDSVRCRTPEGVFYHDWQPGTFWASLALALEWAWLAELKSRAVSLGYAPLGSRGASDVGDAASLPQALKQVAYMVAFLLGRKVCRQGMVQACDDFRSRARAYAQEFQD